MSESNSITVTSQIEKVVVYPDRARIVREGKTEVTGETTRLLMADLPLTIIPDSVRVTGAGSARVRIMGVDLRKRFYAVTPAARAKELEAEIEALQDENRILEDRNRMLDARMTYLDGLREATREYARGLARGQTSVKEQEELLSFLQQGDQAVYEGRREVAKEQRTLKRQLQKLQQELKQIQSSRPRQRYEAAIEIEALSEGEFVPSLSYMVQRAQWHPLYDVRLVEASGGRQLKTSYLAQISQQSGENWDGVRISVSTARPALNQRMPELSPWYVDKFQPPPPMPRAAPAPQRSRMMAMTALDDVMEEAVAESAPPEPVAAEIATAKVQANNISVTYELPGRIDVPSDGSPRKMMVQELEMAPEIDYVTIPRHTDATFRRITVTNASGAPLLAGNASLFVDNAFIGNSHIEYTPGGDKIELLFGVEERIKVSRELSSREVDKRLLRDKRQLRYGYEIKLENLLSTEISLVVKDQIPVSRHEEIKVKLSRATPEPTIHSDMNMLEWELQLGSGIETKIQYEYQVEHPRQMRVSGLLD